MTWNRYQSSYANREKIVYLPITGFLTAKYYSNKLIDKTMTQQPSYLGVSYSSFIQQKQKLAVTRGNPWSLDRSTNGCCNLSYPLWELYSPTAAEKLP